MTNLSRCDRPLIKREREVIRVNVLIFWSLIFYPEIDVNATASESSTVPTNTHSSDPILVDQSSETRFGSSMIVTNIKHIHILGDIRFLEWFRLPPKPHLRMLEADRIPSTISYGTWDSCY